MTSSSTHRTPRHPMTASRRSRSSAATERLEQAFSPEIVDAMERLIDERVAERDRRESAAQEDFGWVTTDRAGEMLGKTADAVTHDIRSGRIPGDSVRKVGRRYYVAVVALDRLIRDAEKSGNGAALIDGRRAGRTADAPAQGGEAP